jgi:hypothetical protein
MHPRSAVSRGRILSAFNPTATTDECVGNGRILCVEHSWNVYAPVNAPSLLPLASTYCDLASEARRLSRRRLLDRQGAVRLAAEVVVEIILSRLERP